MENANDGGNAEVDALQEQLMIERAKNDVLLEQVLKAEDCLADQDMEVFSDVIPNDDREFWRGQLLENRSGTLGVLTRIRNRAAVPDADTAGNAPGPQAAPKPLHNREAAAKAVAARAGGVPGQAPASGADRAAKLRNRAQEIARADSVSFTAAFARAEKEFPA